ncbi:MAG: hypothetical protein AAF415_14380 [Pseudomonadota bacterium]
MSETLEDSIKRWTAKRKSALVLEIIQGKTTVAEASRTYNLTPSEISPVETDDGRTTLSVDLHGSLAGILAVTLGEEGDSGNSPKIDDDANRKVRIDRSSVDRVVKWLRG